MLVKKILFLFLLFLLFLETLFIIPFIFYPTKVQDLTGILIIGDTFWIFLLIFLFSTFIIPVYVLFSFNQMKLLSSISNYLISICLLFIIPIQQYSFGLISFARNFNGKGGFGSIFLGLIITLLLMIPLSLLSVRLFLTGEQLRTKGDFLNFGVAVLNVISAVAIIGFYIIWHLFSTLRF